MSFPARVMTNPNGLSSVTAFRADAAADGQSFYMADSTHPHYQGILKGLSEGDENVWSLFDVGRGVAARLQSITDRVSYDGRNILWDGDPQHSVLADQLRRAIECGENNYEALAKFWEKLESNPNEHSRQQAYDWLACHEFKITPEGDVVGYKGVYQESAGVFRSWHRSTVADRPSGYVNGVAQPASDYVRQSVGDVVSMPRSEVMHDPTVSCHRGLHVATFAYAGSYGDTILEVHVNPRDIVSVPTDASGAKVRACRYTVAAVRTSEAQGPSPVLSENDFSWAGDVSYRP